MCFCTLHTYPNTIGLSAFPGRVETRINQIGMSGSTEEWCRQAVKELLEVTGDRNVILVTVRGPSLWLSLGFLTHQFKIWATKRVNVFL